MKARVGLSLSVGGALAVAYAAGVFASGAATAMIFGVGALLVIAGALTAGWLARRRLERPLARYAAALATLLDRDADGEVPVPRNQLLGALPTRFDELRARLGELSRQIHTAVDTGARREYAEKQALESVVRELAEGVIVCDADGRIVLANPAARRLADADTPLTLGGSIYAALSRGPIEHGLALLSGDEGHRRVAEVICQPTSTSRQLRCKIVVQPALTHGSAAGFALSCTDATAELDAQRRRDALLRGAVEGLRSPIANLRAAAESLASEPTMDAAARSAFENVVTEESRRLSAALEALAQDCRPLDAHTGGSDVSSAELLGQIARRLVEMDGPTLTVTGAPLWCRIDPHDVTELFAHLLTCLAGELAVSAFDVETLMSDRGVCLDIVWEGMPVSQQTLEEFAAHRLARTGGPSTVREIVERHSSELWSQTHRLPGFALLRLPLPLSPRQWQQGDAVAAGRPEFHDFALSERAAVPSEQAAIRLDRAQLVALDTETTGLDPATDEIVAIAGVHITDGAIDDQARFDALVNPGRDIPLQATGIHGIAAGDVRYQPRIEVVLPRFAQFAGARVLVGYNIAFDLRFFAEKAAATGVSFSQPVLDLLPLSLFLNADAQDHELDAIAARVGLARQGRRDAPGDAQLAAQVFCAMLEPLAARGVTTLGRALSITSDILEERRIRPELDATGRA